MVEGEAQRHDLPQGDLVLVLPRHLAHGAQGQDGGLARVQDGRAGVDPEDADVGDGDGAAGEVRRTGLAGPGGVRQLGERRGELRRATAGPRP